LVVGTTYTDNTVTNGVEYCYSVQAVSQHGLESSPSNPPTSVCVAPGPLVVLFLRGDANDNGAADISDAIAILGSLFLGTTVNDCQDAADVNDDDKVDISDPVTLLGHLFLGSERPPDPFGLCGGDPTQDGLNCNTFSNCP
jgi:hypothetical protein